MHYLKRTAPPLKGGRIFKYLKIYSHRSTNIGLLTKLWGMFPQELLKEPLDCIRERHLIDHTKMTRNNVFSKHDIPENNP